MRGLFDNMAFLVVSVNLCSQSTLISFSVSLPNKIILSKIFISFLCPHNVVAKIMSFSSCEAEHSNEKDMIFEEKKCNWQKCFGHAC